MVSALKTQALISPHYDKRYFEVQREFVLIGSVADLIKLASFVKPADAVIDFGCGPGLLLSRLKCSQRIGGRGQSCRAGQLP